MHAQKSLGRRFFNDGGHAARERDGRGVGRVATRRAFVRRMPFAPRTAYCTAADLADGAGRWEHTPGSKAPYRLTRDPARNPLVKGWAFGSPRFWGTCDEGWPANHTRPAVQWAWRPARCRLRPLDEALALCRHLAGPRTLEPHDVLLVGDSFTGQVYISLLALLGGAIVRNEVWPPSGLRIRAALPAYTRRRNFKLAPRRPPSTSRLLPAVPALSLHRATRAPRRRARGTAATPSPSCTPMRSRASTRPRGRLGPARA